MSALARLLWLTLVLWFASLMGLARSQSSEQTFFPASIPLSIRSPYMSVWHPSTNGSQPLSHQWPTFWGQSSIMGWAGKIRVDGETYAWMGQDYNPPFTGNITNVQITPTRTIFVMQAGPMNVTVTFLSPIESSDWVLQSLPFSYVSVEANSLDGQTHSVQVYSDISAEWLSGDRSSLVKWSQQNSGGSLYHKIELQSPQRGVEIAHQAQDGIAYYGMASRPGLTWQIATNPRDVFHDKGTLENSASNAFASIAPVFTVFGIAVDLGQIQSTSEPVTWTIGYVRNPSITYTAADGSVQELSPYFVSKYGADIGAAIDDITAAYSDVLKKSIAFDEAIIGNASQVSSQYADLVSLAARQTMGSLDITVSTDADGKPNASDVKIFMKDIGTSGRVNPVERMYAALPTLVYVNASFLGPLLSPLLEAQDGSTSLPYAAQDLGTSYPNATGIHGAHKQGIEQTGNMLIMLYAHARFSGDGSLIDRHYNLTRRWADYLVNNTLTPFNQASADGETFANMTNLAIKGIIGVKAMAEISRSLGQDFDAQQYDSHASALVGSWQSLALSSDQQHILGIYGNQASWALMYNLYADKLLGTNVVSQTLLQDQAQFYRSLLQSTPPFGLPIDSGASQTTSLAWLLFTAATVQDDGVRNNLINGAWARASSNLTSGAFPSEYDAGTGAILGGTAGPAVGALFSIVALSVPNTTIVVPPSQDNGGGSGKDRSKSNVGAIAGGVVGGVVFLGLFALGVLLFLRRRRRQSRDEDEKIDVLEGPHRPQLSPYRYSPHDNYQMTYGVNSPDSGDANGAGHLEMIGSHTSLMPPQPDRDRAPTGTSKLQELSLNARLAYAESLSGSSNVGSQAGTASSREPLSPLGPRSMGTRTGSQTRSTHSGANSQSMGSLSPTDVLGLRAEVENLRRVMQEIHQERLEPPPEYTG
ncbi:DUF1793-domain-containing protein [Trametes elegans]|nr:DUF1793-domain-containing protein [Trametes elegans]